MVTVERCGIGDMIVEMSKSRYESRDSREVMMDCFQQEESHPHADIMGPCWRMDALESSAVPVEMNP
eukprot:762919-Hanusia_phi.AAC.4